VIALAARQQATDQSEAVETFLVASVGPSIKSVSPMLAFHSSTTLIQWIAELIWSRSMGSPLKIHFHCKDGMFSGASRAILTKNLNSLMSLLKSQRCPTVLMQLRLIPGTSKLAGLNQGMSDLLSHCFFFGSLSSDSGSDPSSG